MLNTLPVRMLSFLVSIFGVTAGQAAAQTPAQVGLEEFNVGKTNVFATTDRTNFQGTIRLSLSYPGSWKLGETNVTDKKGNESRMAVFSNADGDIFTLAIGRNEQLLDL